jgi:hypothetical protein
MQPNNYAALNSEIDAELEALTDKISQPDYCDKTPYADFQRDMAVGLELAQRRIDIYSELIDEVFIDFDDTYFKQFSKRFDERHNQPKP